MLLCSSSIAAKARKFPLGDIPGAWKNPGSAMLGPAASVPGSIIESRASGPDKPE